MLNDRGRFPPSQLEANVHDTFMFDCIAYITITSDQWKYSWLSLPTHIFFAVVAELEDPVDLFQCSIVCKLWNELLQGYQLVKLRYIFLLLTRSIDNHSNH